MASRDSSGGTSIDRDAPGGTGPGMAHPLKWVSMVSRPHSTIRVMTKSVPAAAAPGVASRLAAFVVERYPFAAAAVQKALEAAGVDRTKLRRELSRRIEADVADLPETTPGGTALARLGA